MVGTVLYFAIVYSLPISMGLAAVALDLPVSHKSLHATINDLSGVEQSAKICV